MSASSLRTLTNHITQFALAAHQSFDQDVWQKHPGAVRIQDQGKTIVPVYHNHVHIEAVIVATRALFAALPRTDPCGISSSLTSYLSQNNDAEVEKQFLTQNLESICLLAFATHDLGNLTTMARLDFDNSRPRLSFASEFQFEETTTETRSADIADLLIDHFINSESNEEAMRIKKLVRHLIMQTVFHPGQNHFSTPFWLFMQSVDQIISHSYALRLLFQSTAGYLNELSQAAGVANRVPQDMYHFGNFVPLRFVTLFPEDVIQKQIRTIIDPRHTKASLLTLHNLPSQSIEYVKDIPLLYNFS